LLDSILDERTSLEDFGIKLRMLGEPRSISIEHDSKMINDLLANVAIQTGAGLSLQPVQVFSYLANSIRSGERSIPYSLVTGHTYVVTFLCGRNTPIARRVEIWVPEESSGTLVFHSGDCAEGGALATEYAHSKLQKHEGLLGQVWFTGIPALRPILAADPVGRGAVIAMPFIEAGKLKAITAWYL